MNTMQQVLIVGAVSCGYLSCGFLPATAQRSLPDPPVNDNNGFELIFDGKTLKGWEGDLKIWRAENGCLVGEVTPQAPLKENSFLIWRGGLTRDFELKVEYRVSSRGNSGINYRSVEVPGKSWVMRGYQADIDGQMRNADGMRYTGQNYEELGRTFLALLGQMTYIAEGKKPRVIASLGDTKTLQSFIRSDDWNEYHLIVRGNMLIHILNGQVMSVVIDDDTVNRRFDGLLGVQVHTGPAMKIEYRNFRLKVL